MKEALVILLIVFALLGLTAFRYRKQLAVMLNIWRMLKSAREAHNAGEGQLKEKPVSNGALASCPKCGTWIPQNTAIRLGRNSYYCSSACVEKISHPV